MSVKTKVISILMAVCMIISIISVGGIGAMASTSDSQLAQATVDGGEILHCFDW